MLQTPSMPPSISAGTIAIGTAGSDMMSRRDLDARVKKAVVEACGKKVRIKDSHSLVGSLGFDSLRMVAMALALEEELQRPLLLNDWLSSAADPNQLTVGSLCDYLWGLVNQQT